jgi:hypothetical protein
MPVSSLKNALCFLAVVFGACFAIASDISASHSWRIGTPIVTYWCGPPMTDAAASQMSDGGFNLVWCGEKELDIAQRHGLRVLLTDALLSPATLEQPGQREQLDAFVARVRLHPALYAYFLQDEPSAAQFPGLGKLVAYLREHDPAHLAYINLFPTYASNEQLGTKGDKLTAYNEHLKQFIQTVQPALLSYDHYQFTTKGDSPDYFLNLAMIRRAALDARVPFLNIVQASSWAESIRVPTSDEVRYLVYTTLAYGAQGLSYYIYCCPNHRGGIANADGSPTELFPTLKTLNREFVAIAQELQGLASLGVYHAGTQPPGSEPLPEKCVFSLDPKPAPMTYTPPERVRGVLLGLFGPSAEKGKSLSPTHVLLVNLDYGADTVIGLRGPKKLELFDPSGGKWVLTKNKRVELHLGKGGGGLVRIGP